MRLARPLVVLAIVAFSTLAACGGDSATDPSAVRSFDIASGDSQTTVVGVAPANPLVVRARNASGSGLAGVPVSWSIAAGGGALSATVDSTDASGEARVVYTPGTTAGTATITASTGTLSVVFTATLTADVVAALAPAGGNGSAAIAGSTLPISVKARDRYGNGVAGVAVAWSAGAGTLSAASSTTDASGLARTTLTLGATPGTYVVTASASGLAPVTLTVTAIASGG